MAYAIQNVREGSASDGDYDEDLARWLEESGRRLALAAVFTLSAAQYLYTDIGLQIVQVPSLVVFAVAATR